MRTFNLITSFNGAGLGKDAALLKQLLESLNYSAACTQFTNVPAGEHFDVNIFLEVVNPDWLSHATQNWIMPNSEWWYPQWDPLLPQISKVLCKTIDCQRIWTPKVGADRVIYTSFESNDLFQADIRRKPAFFHLAGNSEAKNTAVILTAWQQFALPYPLFISAEVPGIREWCQKIPAVTFDSRFDDATTKQLQNECRFTILPSRNEGYGHALHEALGCRGVVLTTDAPPMNEFAGIDKRALLPVWRTYPRYGITTFYEVSPLGLRDTVQRMVAMGEDDLDQIGDAARAAFLADRKFFRAKFEEVVAP
jgi:hypothetical protein